MKNYLILLLSLSIFITSCKNDDDAGTSIVYNETDGKQALEDNTIEVLEAIQDFRNNSSLTEVEEFLNVIISDFDEDNTIVARQAKKALTIVQQTNSLSENKISINVYDSKFISSKEENEMSLEEEYNDLVGLHTWNENTGEFNHTENNNNNIIVSVTSNSKTAILTISNFTTTNTQEGEELPASINITLEIDDANIMSMNHSLELDDNMELPSLMSQTATFGTMSYSLNLDNNDDSISFIESMSIGGLNILSIDTSISLAEGLLTDGELSETITILSTNTNISLGKTTLSINGSTPEEINEDDIEDDQKALDLLNESVSITVSTDNVKVADGEFFLSEETHNDYVYNYNSGEYEDRLVTENVLDLRMIFDDGSKADLESYFSVGFDDVERHIEETLDVYTDVLE